MSVVGLEEQKRHMNVDFDEDDDLISTKIDVAESYTTDLIGENIAEMNPVPGALRQAIMMLAAHFYENREATSFDGRANEMPFGFLSLISPYRRWGF